MSYDIELVDKDGELFESKNKIQEGGTYVMGGTEKTHLNITYNYSWFYYLLINKKYGIRWLYDRKAKDCIKVLENAVDKLGTNISDRCSYWCPTPDNAGYALSILLGWAKEFPEGVFKGD